MNEGLVRQNRVGARTLPTAEYHAFGFLAERRTVENIHAGIQRLDEAAVLRVIRGYAHAARHHLSEREGSGSLRRPYRRNIAAGVFRSSHSDADR